MPLLGKILSPVLLQRGRLWPAGRVHLLACLNLQGPLWQHISIKDPTGPLVTSSAEGGPASIGDSAWDGLVTFY